MIHEIENFLIQTSLLALQSSRKGRYDVHIAFFSGEMPSEKYIKETIKLKQNILRIEYNEWEGAKRSLEEKKSFTKFAFRFVKIVYW